MAFGRPEIEAMIDGKGPFKFLVDSGAGSTVINADLAEELGLEVVGATAIGDPINPEAIQANIVAVPSLEIGGAKFEDFQAASWNHQDLLKGKGGDLPRGVIGFPTFVDVLLTFDYVDGKLRIANGELPKADGKTVLAYQAPMGAAATGPPASGMRFASHGDGDLEVFSVEPGSPAAKAGVQAGDKVLEINGTALSALADDARRAATRVSPLMLKLESGGVTREVTVVFP